MTRRFHIHFPLFRFVRGTSGATAVEFAILLPVMLVTFGAIVEGSRIYWNYQAAVNGVRDAARYIARTTNNDVCGLSESTDTAIVDGQDTATEIINRNLDKDGNGLFPPGVTLSAPVSATFDCVLVADVGIVPVAVVDATVQVQLPFASLFAFFGSPGDVTSIITDQSRIYGL